MAWVVSILQEKRSVNTSNKQNSDSQFRESKKCCICDLDDYRVCYEWPANFYPHDQFETASWDGRTNLPLTIVECSNCSMVYTRPSFKEQHLGLIYPDDIVPASTDSAKLLATRKWDGIISCMKRHLPQGSTVCDVGTRYGVLVKQLAEHGFSSWGVEYNAAAVSKSIELGIENVFEGTIKTIGHIREKHSIDRVNGFVLDDVLEHLVNPAEEISALAENQKSGDFIFARQMNWNSLGHKLFRKSWYYLQPGAHMYFFDPQSAKKLFDNAGYDIVEIQKAPLTENICSFRDIAVGVVKRLLGRGRRNWNVNGKEMYLNRRSKLSDMFLVVAKKR